jgi:hypothetical protein
MTREEYLWMRQNWKELTENRNLSTPFAASLAYAYLRNKDFRKTIAPGTRPYTFERATWHLKSAALGSSGIFKAYFGDLFTPEDAAGLLTKMEAARG